jgi:hypothetical protein
MDKSSEVSVVIGKDTNTVWESWITPISQNVLNLILEPLLIYYNKDGKLNQEIKKNTESLS